LVDNAVNYQKVPRILLIDDDLIFGQIFTEFSRQKYSCPVTFVPSVNKIEQLVESEFDLAIVDFPAPDGPQNTTGRIDEAITKTKTTTKTKAAAQRAVARSRAAREVKGEVLHLRVDRTDLDALDVLATRTGLDRSALARLVIRAGLRVAERDVRDLLAPSSPSTGEGS
jgi:CheY-like chemotaxis protein